MAGTIKHLQNETVRIVALFKADQFVVADGGTGPFTTTRLLPASTAGTISRLPGVQRADPFVNARENLKGKDVNIVGIIAQFSQKVSEAHDHQYALEQRNTSFFA